LLVLSQEMGMGEASTAANEAPKLLTLDKADIRAIRSFLPGKVLGRTAALLALVVLVLGFATSVDVGLERFIDIPLEPPWLKHTLLLGIPLFVVGAQILAEWHAERGRHQAQQLAVKTEAVQEGYFRIGPYLDTAEDRAKFDRADKIHEKLLDWILRSDAIPLYLTGDSGSGKSSVLNAFVLPSLRDAGWTIIEARAWQDPEMALREAISKFSRGRKWKLVESNNIPALLEALARRVDGRLLVVLDQFEEFVILADSERQRAFAALTAEFRATSVKGLKLLLVLRSDYQSAVEELGLPLLRQGQNWNQVARFTIAAGIRFMGRSGLTLHTDSLDRVATSASELDDSPGMIRPVTLNVLGHVLSQGRAIAPSIDADRLVRHYIEQSIEQPAIREFALPVVKELVTEQGTKRPRSEKEIVDQTRLRPGEVRAVMNCLWAAALARPLDRQQGVWELSHDFVARAVGRYLGRRRLDLPRIIRAFAAPTLFVLMAAAAAGVFAWNVGDADRIRSQCAELGIEVSSTPTGLAADASSRFLPENLFKVVALLGRLTTLQSLNIRGTGVEDLGPMKGLTRLQSLDIGGTQVVDLRPLKGLTALQSLSLANTQVVDLGPLKGLTTLRSLDLDDTQVVDLGPASGLTALQSLNIFDTKVVDLGPVSGLTALQSLEIGGTKVLDLGPVSGLTALKSLDICCTQVVDLGPLKGLTALRSLDLRNTQVADLGPVSGLTALPSLDIGGTKVRDLGPVSGLTALKSLKIGETRVGDLRPLKALIALQTLDISRTRVANLGPLEGLTALQFLDISDTEVVDLGPLKGLTALKSLGLSETGAADLASVQDLPNLKEINGASVPDEVMQRFHAYRAQKGLPKVHFPQNGM
jgi:Leucine-rich repeat (LRR) protein